jgi:hypothetical protein
MKKIDIKEFRELGYLQELNRTFLHPLGLALSISVDENGNECLSDIFDYRDDEIYYDIKNSDIERKENFKKNEKFINNEQIKRANKRYQELGFNIEPIL